MNTVVHGRRRLYVRLYGYRESVAALHILIPELMVDRALAHCVINQPEESVRQHQDQASIPPVEGLTSSKAVSEGVTAVSSAMRRFLEMLWSSWND